MMGSEKRERQKAQRAARMAAAQEAERKSARRRRIITAGVIAGAVVVILAVIALFGDDDEAEVASDEEVTEDSDVSGEPCVGLTGDLPAEAPDFEAPEGDPPTDLVVEDLVEGEGKEVVEGDTVVANYLGVACSTGEIFEEAFSGDAVEFSLDEVIEGWQAGLPGMAEGGTRLLTIPPELAYADRGSSPRIAPGETLTFVVELVEVPEDD